MTDHYFSARPGAPHRPGQVRVILPDVYLELATDAGVFSPGRLDPGTRLLRLAAKPTVIMLLAGTVPIMTFIVERWVTRRFIDPALGGGSGQAQPAAPAVR